MNKECRICKKDFVGFEGGKWYGDLKICYECNKFIDSAHETIYDHMAEKIEELQRRIDQLESKVFDQ